MAALNDEVELTAFAQWRQLLLPRFAPEIEAEYKQFKVHGIAAASLGIPAAITAVRPLLSSN
jgi:predicted unusual protein kinase regulating ubiquinone biosynthesis (AarF/ABC1/UbiB family)